jgi:hypothetical protein
VVYLGLHERRWQEAYPTSRRYREHPLEELEARRDREARRRQRQAAQLRRQRQRLLDRGEHAAARELEREISAAGLRLDAQPDRVRLEHFPQDRRQVEWVVDGQARSVTVEHYQVRVNQAAKPAVELWVTRDVELPVRLLDFYRAMNLFQAGVADRLEDVPGVVVEATLRVQQGALTRDLTTRVLRVRTDPPLREADLRLPPGWEAIREDATAGEPQGGCPVCGAPADGYRFGRRAFCSSAHRRQYMNRPRRRAGAGSSAAAEPR